MNYGRLTQARVHEHDGRLREAEELYASLLRQHADQPDVWIEAAQVAGALGEDDTAMRRLRHADSLTPFQSARWLAAAARQHMHAGRAASAGLCWWKLAHREPADARAWAGLLVCALAARKGWLALRVRMTLNDGVDSAEARRLIAEQWRHMAGGALLDAIRNKQVESKAPAEVDRTPLRSLLASAAQTLERHADKHPRRADTHYHLSTCRDALGETIGAIEAIDAALTINPNYLAAQRLADRLAQPEDLALAA